MQYWKVMVLAPAIMLAAACNRKDDRAAADSALNRDLTLANQVAPSDSISPLEAGAAPAGAVKARTSTTPRPAARTTARRSTTRRSSSGNVSTSSGGTVTSSSGGTYTKKNNNRDAAIGAAAGAVIGATTSRDKVKGAVIGGVIGGVLGGVIGNNVDIQKKKKPPQ